MNFQKFLIHFLLLLTGLKCYSQEKGYKDLLIGVKLFDRKLIETYKYYRYNSDSNAFRLESILPQFICDEKVDYIDVKIKKDSSIDYVDLYTQGIIIEDVNGYFNRHKNITNCIVNTVGKAYYYEDGNDRKDGQMTMAWALSDDIILALYTNSLSIYDKNVKRIYKFAWFKNTDSKKMW